MDITLNADLKRALSGDRTPKFLATQDAQGHPNCVPVISIMPYDESTLVFGEFLMNKSRKNLSENARVGVTVFTDSFEGWSLKCTFLGFETTGERVETINRLPMLRYNAYTSIRAAGVLRVEEISPRFTLSKTRYLMDFLRVSALARVLPRPVPSRICMPARVKEKFGRMQAVRAAAFVGDDGFPAAFPAMACVPAGEDRLAMNDPIIATFTPRLRMNTFVAVAVITTEPIAYQVKGLYAGRRAGVGIVDIQECYSASPPLLGVRLDPAAT